LFRRPPFLSRARVGKNGSNPILEENKSRFNSANRRLERLTRRDDSFRATALNGAVAPKGLNPDATASGPPWGIAHLLREGFATSPA
jgi:hypothetical protein